MTVNIKYPQPIEIFQKGNQEISPGLKLGERDLPRPLHIAYQFREDLCRVFDQTLQHSDIGGNKMVQTARN